VCFHRSTPSPPPPPARVGVYHIIEATTVTAIAIDPSQIPSRDNVDLAPLNDLVVTLAVDDDADAVDEAGMTVLVGAETPFRVAATSNGVLPVVS
jgi:hypothetical protein